jgi:hypothetical protein
MLRLRALWLSGLSDRRDAVRKDPHQPAGLVQGSVACKIASDDVSPFPAPPQGDIFAAIQERYSFAAQPEQFGLQLPGAPSQYMFQNGKFVIGDEIHAIAQLVMEMNGDVVTSTSTDVAELIMDDLTKFLDERFKYDFHSSPQTRSYVSTVIAQFEPKFEEKISALNSIVRLITEAHHSGQNFFLQRLAFSTGVGQRIVAHNPFLPQSQITIIERAEYTIERRAGSSVADNRYFCSAPLRTSDHLRTLEEIEKLLIDPPK